MNLDLYKDRKRFIIINGIVHIEIDKPYENFYAGIDLKEYSEIQITGKPIDCQILVQLNSNKIITKAFNVSDEFNLSHFFLLQYEILGANNFYQRSFRYDESHGYLIIYGDNREFYAPIPLENIVDQDENDCSSTLDVLNAETVTVSDDEEWPSIFMSEKQIKDNITKIDSIVNNCCDMLKKSGIIVKDINDLIALYLQATE
jgi:hypothetical protein